MKYKIFGFIIASFVFLCAYNIKAEAKTLGEYQNIILFWDHTYDTYRLLCSDAVPTGEYTFSWQNMDVIYIYTNTGNWDDWTMSDPNLYESVLNNQATNTGYTSRFYCWKYLKVIKGSFGGYVPDYTIIPEPEPEPESSWWEKMWDWLKEDMEKPLGFIWFQNLINDIFGDDSEGTISDNVSFSNPTIAPTPTPISYTTVVIPKTDPVSGDTYYETNYYYVNPSGTPIITSSPPSNTPATGSPGYNPGSDYFPIGGDPYSLPKLDWLTTATIGDDDYDGIDSIMDGIGSIDTIGSEYKVGLSTVQDATGTLPTDWLLLIGIAAAIPLIAGIISRFLS